MKTLGTKANIMTAAVIFMIANATAGAETYPFRVAFENVPGAAELEAGDIDAGIDKLERQIDDGDADTGFVLATLCGAYVLDGALRKADRICDRAVTQYPGETAFNNRGVLRAFKGDFRGAQADFDQARPERMAEYLDYLKTKDVGLIADGNFGLLEELAAKHSPVDVKSSVAANAIADIEPIRD